ncbi:hypothetical protein EXIGLDRAFT_707265 [Exidia glandulosa HHB12029]|uniref:Uncharacterized protein n=1 Tax=Exidia glandulosa HHB12029 TaxID=1314781 RepID=A0A166NLT5_EXIGL|nr:hypothetical protein EXIGLDRAFT_707265 [Exidia glandulosa HHB12029]
MVRTRSTLAKGDYLLLPTSLRDELRIVSPQEALEVFAKESPEGRGFTLKSKLIWSDDRFEKAVNGNEVREGQSFYIIEAITFERIDGMVTMAHKVPVNEWARTYLDATADHYATSSFLFGPVLLLVSTLTKASRPQDSEVTKRRAPTPNEVCSEWFFERARNFHRTVRNCSLNRSIDLATLQQENLPPLSLRSVHTDESL